MIVMTKKSKKEKKEKKLGPIKYVTYVDKHGKKSRRLLVGSKMIFGLNDHDKPHGDKPERGKHVHLPWPGKRELKVYLNGKRPIVEVKKSRAARRREEKRKRRRKD